MRTPLIAALLIGLFASATRAGTGPVGHWNFDEGQGDVVRDRSGNGNHGKIKGAKWIKSGPGHALRFDGVDDYVDCGHGKSLDLTETVTLMAWVRPTAANRGEPGIAGKFFESFALTYYGNGYFYISSGGNNVSGPTKINTWTHIAGTFDGTRMRFYVNGIESASKASKFKSIKHGNNFFVGCVFGDATSEDENLQRTSFFPGHIDDVRLYDRGLSQKEVLQCYNMEAEQKGLPLFDMSRFGKLALEPFFYPDQLHAVLSVDFRWVLPLPDAADIVVELAPEGATKPLQTRLISTAAPRGEDEARFSLKDLEAGAYEFRARVRRPDKVIQAEKPARKSSRVTTYAKGWQAGRMNLFGGWAEYEFKTPAGEYQFAILAARIYDSAGVRCTIDGKGPTDVVLTGTESGGPLAWDRATWDTFATYRLAEGRHTLRVQVIPVRMEERNKTYASNAYIDAFALYAIAPKSREEKSLQRVTFRLPFASHESLPSPGDKAAAPLPPTVTPPKYKATIEKGGGLLVTVKGTSFRVESVYSYPGGGFNTLAAAPFLRTGERGWKVRTGRTLGGTRAVTGIGRFYSIARTIELQPSRILIRDTIRNKSDEVLGVILSNRINIKGHEDAAVTRLTNPTIFVGEGGAGVGLIALDDLYQLQQHNAFANGIAEIRDEHFGLDKGASYTIEWAVYPTATADYYDFINQVRKDEGLNGRAEGAWVGMPRFRVPAREFIDMRRARYLSVGTPWYPVDARKEAPRVSIEGIEYMEYPKECARIRKFFGDVKRAHPDVKVMIHVAHGLYCCNNPKERFPDSLAIDANGRQMHYGPNNFTYYGRYWTQEMFDDNWRWWIFYPTLENSFGKAMIKAMEYMMDDMGATAMWADGYLSGYVKGLYSYDRWDGHSVTIDPKTKRVTRKKNLVPHTSLPALKKVIRLIAERGGVLITNGIPGPRSLWKEPYITSSETGGGDARPVGGLHLGRTVTPLGNPGAIKNERDVYRDILTKLDFGALFFWYGAYSLPTHKTLVEHMYPITFESIHAGTVRGKERIITKNSGAYGWHGDRSLHAVYFYDARGELTRDRFITTVDRDAVRTQLALETDQSAAVVRVPITLTARGPVNVNIRQYSSGGIRIGLNGNTDVTLQVSDGDFAVKPGAAYNVTVADKTSTVTAGKGLTLSATLRGATELTVIPKMDN